MHVFQAHAHLPCTLLYCFQEATVVDTDVLGYSAKMKYTEETLLKLSRKGELLVHVL